MPAKIRIKFLARTHADHNPALWLSLFPGRRPEFGNCVFTFDVDARRYDWLVVYEDLTLLPRQKRSNRSEPLACNKSNTLFITSEPSSVKHYGPAFLAQYGHVMSKQPRHIINHTNQIFQTPPLRWFYGRALSPESDEYLDYDALSAMPPMSKSRDLSTVCSDKQMNPALKARYQFVARLKDILGDEFDWFGRGIRPVKDKAEAMNSFRYHIAIENHVEPGHWTEKIADCFLAYCLPFYHGAPDIANYFPDGSVIPIDINDPGGSAQTILQTIKENVYEKRLPAIIKARDQVLNEYNIMQTISGLVEERHVASLPGSSLHKIYGRHAFRRKFPLRAMTDVLKRRTR